MWCNPKAVPTNEPDLPASDGGYRASPAQLRAHLAQTMARRPTRLASDNYLWSEVKQLLKQRYSPEQIAGILSRMFPDDLSIRINHETIYTALNAMPLGELRTELLATLRQAESRRVLRRHYFLRE